MNERLIKLFTAVVHLGAVILAVLAIVAMGCGLVSLIRFFIGV